MRFLLDTNVVSELRKEARANRGVRSWFEQTTAEDLALSVLVLAEIRLGILRLRRRDPQAANHLASWLEQVSRHHEGRILPVDEIVARHWADLNAVRTLPVVDSLMAATALAHGLTLVTRNERDFAGVDVKLVNPFESV